jgi:hypothetical protein
MMRSAFVLGARLVSAFSVVGFVVCIGERDAAACGGCFTPPPPPTQVASDVTDERMLLAVSPMQSTLYDQLEYTGNPASFAWVLPIRGTVDVGLSADVLFDSIDTLTATQIPAPPQNCAPSPSCPSVGGASAAEGVAVGPDDNSMVTVTKQANVGPYDTVQLHSTDSSALENWLTQNAFVIPTAEQPVIAAYVAEGFDFLAMKLLPNEGVQAMRPVRVTTPGASLSLPLRMASIGTGATVGITIWVVSDGRYEPQNFPFFHIDDSALVWDWSTNASNYAALRATNEQKLGGKGWEIESSITLSQQTITNVILSGGQYSSSGGVPSGNYSQATPSDATQDYLAVGDPDAGADGGSYESADDVRTADIATLFVGLQAPNVRVTRIRSDIAHAAMTQDFLLQASSDQSELSNVRTVTKSANLVCPSVQSCNPIGCAASSPSPPRGGLAAGLGALAGMLALIGARGIRARRRS